MSYYDTANEMRDADRERHLREVHGVGRTIDYIRARLDDVTESKLCITHGGFTTLMEREACAFSSSRVGKCRWVEGWFVSADAALRPPVSSSQENPDG